MSDSQAASLWAIRVAALLYAAAIAAWIMRRESAKALWTLGCAAFLLHVGTAFAYFHGWSHQAAYEETARRTQEVFGVRSGGGLYLNYLFAALWTVDAVWVRIARRPRLWVAAVHGFMAFLFFNAAVVFPKTAWVRWASIAAIFTLAALYLIRRRSGGSSPAAGGTTP